MTEPITLQVNGEARTVARALDVGGLLEELGLGERPVAVERNGELVPRRAHGETILEDGDRVEIVTLVGGG